MQYDKRSPVQRKSPGNGNDNHDDDDDDKN